MFSLVRVLFRLAVDVGRLRVELVVADRGVFVSVRRGDRRWIGGIGRVE